MTTDNSSQETAPTSAPESTAGSVETTTAPTQTASSTTAPQTEASKTDAPVVSPQYNPNYKFKAYDKEYEVEDLFKPLIKDAETEKKVRELHAKAYALEHMQEKFNKHRTESTQFKTSIEPKLRAYDYFNVLLENKDWDTLFGKLGVPDDEIFKYVEHKLKLAEAGPEQKAEYARQVQLREQNYMQSQQLTEMQQAYQQQAVQTRTMQLDSLLNRPDVQQYAVGYDERLGTIGAFRQLVADEAAAVFHTTGRDLSVEEAVNHVIQKFGKLITPQAVQGPQGQGQMAQQPAQRPPIIPNVSGRGTSPVKKVPRSLEDLQKLADEMSAQ